MSDLSPQNKESKNLKIGQLRCIPCEEQEERMMKSEQNLRGLGETIKNTNKHSGLPEGTEREMSKKDYFKK